MDETHILLRLSSAHYIHKSPNLFHTAVTKIIIKISIHSATPTAPLPFFPQIPLTSPLSCILSATSFETEHTFQSHICLSVRGAHEHKHTHFLVCVGGYQFFTGHSDYVFSVLPSGEEIRTRQPTAKPDSIHLSQRRTKKCDEWRPVPSTFFWFYHFTGLPANRRGENITNMAFNFKGIHCFWAESKLSKLTKRAVKTKYRSYSSTKQPARQKTYDFSYEII